MNRLIVIAMGVVMIVGCKSAYYGMWSKLGYEKRDILVSDVEKAKTSQEQAKDQFKTTMQSFQELTNFNGGDLEAKYKKLSAEYDSCESRAAAVSKRIKDVDGVSQDLFKEWNTELGQYDNADLRRSSEQKLNESKAQYAQLSAAMHKSEASMQPVLKAFHDQVLYLKHNLNAEAITSLQGTAAGINTDVQALIKDMEASINEANDFIGHMKTTS